MTPLAFLLVLGSAGLHATWNLIAKKSGASLAFYATLALVGFLWSSGVHFFTPLRFLSMPPAFFVWLAGMAAAEMAYAVGLNLSYRTLDMSVAYPMMRSLPLLLIAGITTLFGLGEPLTVQAMIGMAVLFAGCLLMPLKRFSDLKIGNYLNRGMLCILTVALGTTLYTVFDKQSQQIMRDAFPQVSKVMISMTYYSFRATTLATALWIIVLCLPNTRAEAAEIWRRRSWMPVLAGLCSSLTYFLVLIAMNHVTNVSYVQAFRQLGLVVGMLEGILILKERCTATKVLGIVLIVSGLVMTVV